MFLIKIGVTIDNILKHGQDIDDIGLKGRSIYWRSILRGQGLGLGVQFFPPFYPYTLINRLYRLYKGDLIDYIDYTKGTWFKSCEFKQCEEFSRPALFTTAETIEASSITIEDWGKVYAKNSAMNLHHWAKLYAKLTQPTSWYSGWTHEPTATHELISSASHDSL